MTPTSAAILSGESRIITAVDQFGRVPTEVAWSSSDETIATVAADEDGVVFATGVAPGTATLTADLDGETATMTLAVYAGVSLPAGTRRWTAPSRSGIVAADTIFTSDFGGPDALYSIEYATLYGDEKKQATVRSYGVDGMENWFGALPTGDDEIIKKVMPHASGGIVAVLHSYADPPVPAAVIRYSGTDDASWRYESGAWRMQAATGGNGTVFVVEELLDGTPRLAVLDGQSGAVIARHPLPQLVLATDSSSNALSIDPVGFTVDARGHARFILQHGWWRYGVDGGSLSHTLDLYDVAPDGTASTTQLDSLSRTPVSSFYYLRPESLTPDSDGVLALFVKAEGAGQDEQWKGKYVGESVESFDLPEPWKPTLTTIDGYGVGRGSESTDPLVARNLRTGEARWQSAAEGEPVVALGGGGAAVISASGVVQAVNAVGEIAGAYALNALGVPYIYGRFHVRDVTNALLAVPWMAINDATAFLADGPARSAGPPTQWGIFGKSHRVAFIWRHVALRLLPRNQRDWLEPEGTWREEWVSHFKKKKPAVYGELAFVTAGAGPSGPLFSGYLNAGFNRKNDEKDNAVDHAWMPLSVGDEENAIRTVLTRTADFQNNVLEYTLDPDPGDSKYNSNSFLRGLLEASELPIFTFPVNDSGSSWRFAGWAKPVPSPYFHQP